MKEKDLLKANYFENQVEETLGNALKLAKEVEAQSTSDKFFMDELSFSCQADGTDTVTVNDKEYVLTDHSKAQLLKSAGVPASFYEKVSPELRQSILTERGNQKTMHKLFFIEVGKTNILRAAVAAAGAIMPTSQYLSALIKRYGEDAVIFRPVLNMNLFSGKLILPDQEEVAMEKDAKDKYQKGIQLQYSEVDFAPLIATSMLFRVVCSNGLIDVTAQEEVLKKKRMAVDAETVSLLLRSAEKQLDDNPIVKALNDLHSEGKEITVRKALDTSKKLLDGVPRSHSSAMLKGIQESLPGDAKHKLPVYDFVNMITERVQTNMPVQYQNKVEANVGTFLASIAG